MKKKEIYQSFLKIKKDMRKLDNKNKTKEEKEHCKANNLQCVLFLLLMRLPENYQKRRKSNKKIIKKEYQKLNNIKNIIHNKENNNIRETYLKIHNLKIK